MNRNELTRSVRSILAEQGMKELSFTSESDFDRILLGFTLHCKYDAVMVRVTIFETSVIVQIHCPEEAGTSVRMEMAKYLTMANFGMKLGCFEMDMNSGEIHFRTTIEAIDLSGKPMLTVMRALIMGARIFNQYGDGMYSIIHGQSNARAAIAKAEG